jgi:hypothetical protein
VLDASTGAAEAVEHAGRGQHPCEDVEESGFDGGTDALV